jgi:hypothetical protein
VQENEFFTKDDSKNPTICSPSHVRSLSKYNKKAKSVVKSPTTNDSIFERKFSTMKSPHSIVRSIPITIESTQNGDSQKSNKKTKKKIHYRKLSKEESMERTFKSPEIELNKMLGIKTMPVYTVKPKTKKSKKKGLDIDDTYKDPTSVKLKSKKQKSKKGKNK